MSHDQEKLQDADGVFDLTVVGGGPAGLFGAAYAGFRGLRTKIIDSLNELGGQVSALYPEKYIYDVAGFPRILGKDLVENLIRQCQACPPTVCLGEKVLGLEAAAGGGILLSTDKGQHETKAVLLAAGFGMFTPKRLPVPEAAEFEGKGLAYFVKSPEDYRGKRVLVVGGGDSAVDWALQLSSLAAAVTLAHRRDGFRAHEESLRRLKESPVRTLVFHEVRCFSGNGRLEGAVVFHNKTGVEESLPLDAVLGCLGFETHLGPLAEWGLALEGRSINVNSRMETNIPGVYAAGDVAGYLGKVRLIATGFGEAATAVNNAAAFINPAAALSPGHSSGKHGTVP